MTGALCWLSGESGGARRLRQEVVKDPGTYARRSAQEIREKVSACEKRWCR